MGYRRRLELRTVGSPGVFSFQELVDNRSRCVAATEQRRPCLAALPGTLAPYKTRTLARANPVALDNSTPPAGSLVIIAFNNMEDVKAFWNSPAYQAIIPLREKSAMTRVYAVEGVPQ